MRIDPIRHCNLATSGLRPRFHAAIGAALVQTAVGPQMCGIAGFGFVLRGQVNEIGY